MISTTDLKLVQERFDIDLCEREETLASFVRRRNAFLWRTLTTAFAIATVTITLGVSLDNASVTFVGAIMLGMLIAFTTIHVWITIASRCPSCGRSTHAGLTSRGDVWCDRCDRLLRPDDVAGTSKLYDIGEQLDSNDVSTRVFSWIMLNCIRNVIAELNVALEGDHVTLKIRDIEGGVREMPELPGSFAPRMFQLTRTIANIRNGLTGSIQFKICRFAIPTKVEIHEVDSSKRMTFTFGPEERLPLAA